MAFAIETSLDGLKRVNRQPSNGKHFFLVRKS